MPALNACRTPTKTPRPRRVLQRRCLSCMRRTWLAAMLPHCHVCVRTAGRAPWHPVLWHATSAQQSCWQLQVEEKKREKAKFEKERMLLEKKVARKREQVDKKVRGCAVHGTTTCLQHAT